MTIFRTYLNGIPFVERVAFERILRAVRMHVPEVGEGTSYGMPAFKYKNRPLLGFSSNQYGLNLYPFDPRVIRDLQSELAGFELGKGVIRFRIDNQPSDELIKLILDVRIGYIDNTTR